MYWKYLLYVIEHKWNVGIECVKMGMPFHAVTHDLSKFLPSEFFPYAKFFYSKNRTKEYKQTDENDENFQTGWCYHQKRNKHHWNYWVSVTRKDEVIPIPMPRKYIRQMVADWRGMSRKFGGSPAQYYRDNHHKFIMHHETIEHLREYLSEHGG